MSVSVRRMQRGAASPAGDGFVLGTTKPSADSVGYRAGTVFAQVAGNVTYAADYELIENTQFTGQVSVTGKNITFRNCYFTPIGQHLGCVVAQNANVENLLIERCTFRPAVAATINDACSSCVFGHDVTLLRCDLSGAIDGVDIYRTVDGGNLNVNIYGCWLHDLAYWSPDSSHSDNQTHSDLVQIHYGGNGIHILGSRMDGTIDPSIGSASEPSVEDGNGNHISGNLLYPSLVSMSVIMAAPVGVTAGLDTFIFEQNWADGGAVIINWPRDDAVNVQILNNRWGHNSYLGDSFTVLAKVGQPMTIAGNYYEDTGIPYDGRKNG